MSQTADPLMLVQSPPEQNSPEWNDLVLRISAELGRPICAAKRNTKKKPHAYGWPCENRPKRNGRCKFHGGNNRPAGPEHPRWKNGRYSKVLGGTSLSDLYLQARSDPQLLALSEEIAVLAGKLQLTLSKLNQGGDVSSALWAEALQGMKTLRRYLKKGRKTEALALISHLQDIFSHALNDFNVWNDWFNGIEQLRKLVDTERKYREGMKINLAPEQGTYMLNLIAQAARDVLPPDMAEALRKRVAELRHATAKEKFLHPRNITMVDAEVIESRPLSLTAAAQSNPSYTNGNGANGNGNGKS